MELNLLTQDHTAPFYTLAYTGMFDKTAIKCGPAMAMAGARMCPTALHLPSAKGTEKELLVWDGQCQGVLLDHDRIALRKVETLLLRCYPAIVHFLDWVARMVQSRPFYQ